MTHQISGFPQISATKANETNFKAALESQGEAPEGLMDALRQELDDNAAQIAVFGLKSDVQTIKPTKKNPNPSQSETFFCCRERKRSNSLLHLHPSSKVT